MTTTTTVLFTLIAGVLADGMIDGDEVNQLREAVYDDGEVDVNEIQAVFQLVERVDDPLVPVGFDTSATQQEFISFCQQVVYDYAAADGEIDDEEAQVIRTAIEGDGQVSYIEEMVLRRLLSSGATMPSDFREWATAMTNRDSTASV